jgi:hypothetical protein
LSFAIFAREGVFELPSRLRGIKGVAWWALAKKANEFPEVLCGSGKQELVVRARQSAQSQPAEVEMALKMGEAHFRLSCAAAPSVWGPAFPSIHAHADVRLRRDCHCKSLGGDLLETSSVAGKRRLKLRQPLPPFDGDINIPRLIFDAKSNATDFFGRQNSLSRISVGFPFRSKLTATALFGGYLFADGALGPRQVLLPFLNGASWPNLD